MKKIIRIGAILCLLVSMTLQLSAQKVLTVGNSDLKYVKEHVLYQNGEETNVIDIDVEWPSMIDFTLVKPLQSFLAKAVFRANADNLEDAMNQMKARFGQPVTSQFKTIPDDQKFCYVTCKLSQMGYVKNRFISFRSTYTCAPEKFSTQRADTTTMLITYDLINQRVMQMKDILRMDVLRSGGITPDVLLLLLNGASMDVPNDLNELHLLDACMMDRYVWLDMSYATDNDTQNFHSLVSFDGIKRMMTRNARKLTTMDIPNHPMETVVLEPTFEGQPVYSEVDKQPEFRGGMDGLKQYLASNVEYPLTEQALKIEGRVTVAFIVDEKGDIRDTHVINHISPGIDREAVRVVRMMPQWTPGELGGKKVNVRYQLPINFKLN